MPDLDASKLVTTVERSAAHDQTLLINEKREAFCQALATGKTHKQAYILAGYANTPNGVVNATRLATHPIIIARVKEIQQSALVARLAEQRADELVLKRMEREKLYNVDWVLLQAKEILDAAKTASKYKDALSALGFIADLLGYTNHENNKPADKKKDANKREPGDPENHTNVPQVNVSILNQITKRLDDSLRDGDQTRTDITIEPEEDFGDTVSVPGPNDTTDDDK
jgi:phage terminase small subunit